MNHNPHFTSACFVLMIMGIAEACLPRNASAQNGPVQEGQTATYMGHKRCSLCHDKGLDDRNVTARRDLCLLNESRVFYEHDKHRLAYMQLFDERGVKMLQQLGIPFDQQQMEFTDLDGEEAAGKRLTAKSCLSCHANWLTSMPAPPAKEVLLAGVNCESCHGPGSAYDLPHSQPGQWRVLTAEEKSKSYGMFDVRNPVRRAEQCFSCHIGNADEGKVVTHEMYAAGHPPLPGMEIESFATQMPQHWRYLPEKSDFALKDKYLEANFSHRSTSDPTDDLPRSKAVVVGAVVAAREWLELFAALSEPEHGPEFAVYDCQACHHELKQANSSWRQKRGYGKRVPGRPTALEWPSALLFASLQLVVGDDSAASETWSRDLNSRMSELDGAIAQQPFGNSATIRDIIHGPDGLSERLTQLAHQIEARPVTRGDVLRILEVLYESSDNVTPDYHSARQIAWASRTLEKELRLDYPSRSEFPVRKIGELDTQLLNEQELEVLRELYTRRSSIGLHIDNVFEPLNMMLHLTLPAQQSGQIERDQGQWLRKISEYDPAVFREALQRTRSRLTEK